VPAPLEVVHLQPRSIRQLHDEDLARVDLGKRLDRHVTDERVKAVEDDADRGVIDRPHDLPGLPLIPDITTPGECLVADAQATGCGAIA
jgi:hypothetical protein